MILVSLLADKILYSCN